MGYGFTIKGLNKISILVNDIKPVVIGEGVVASINHFSLFVLNFFFNDDTSECHIVINGFNFIMAKARDQPPKGFPLNILHNETTHNNQSTKAVRFFEHIFEVKNFYPHKDDPKSYLCINLSFYISYPCNTAALDVINTYISNVIIK